MEILFVLLQIVIIEDYILAQLVTLSGPKYIKKGQIIELDCICSYGSVYRELLLNGKSYDSRCKKIGKVNQTNKQPAKEVFRFTVDESAKEGTQNFTCQVQFPKGEQGGRLSVHILDLSGPSISSLTGLPFIALETTTVICTVNTTLKNFNLTLECQNETTTQHYNDGSGTKVVRLRFSVVPENNFTICTCAMEWNDYVTMESLEVEIQKIPIIVLKRNHTCTTTSTTSMSCEISGDLSSFGFYDWKHSVNGRVIRYLRSENVLRKSILTIRSCSYQDFGEYTCSAWNIDGAHNLSASFTTLLNILGPPNIVTSTINHTSSGTVLSAVVLSSIPITSTQWFTYNTYLENSSQHIYGEFVDTANMEFYGVEASILTNISTLTVRNTTDVHFTAVFANQYGKAKKTFTIRKDMSYFDRRIVYWCVVVLGVFLVTVTTATILHNRKMTKYNAIQSKLSSSANIYHAAPSFSPEVTGYHTINTQYDVCDINLYEEIQPGTSSECKKKENDYQHYQKVQ